MKLDLPPNKFKSKSLDQGIDVFAAKYRQGSEHYKKVGLERWQEKNGVYEDDCHFDGMEPEDYGLEFADTF